MDTPCNEYENGTALHIASANLSVNAAKVLLQFGADLDLKVRRFQSSFSKKAFRTAA